jgi:hypothetical protein
MNTSTPGDQPSCPNCDQTARNASMMGSRRRATCAACVAREADELGDSLARSCTDGTLSPTQRQILACAAATCYEKRDRARDEAFQRWLQQVQHFRER